MKGSALLANSLQNVDCIPSALCACVQVFTTVHPGQSEVSLIIYQGESQVASRNKQLGQFHLVGLPEAPVGVPQVEVQDFSSSLHRHPAH